jgi:hypothetical protein
MRRWMERRRGLATFLWESSMAAAKAAQCSGDEGRPGQGHQEAVSWKSMARLPRVRPE